ncbi:Gamma-glutamyltranspeptidase 3 [Turnera subulata]|uniref:Glutathione hydrolase n=1 Tax=Turnera subulata TaxID=218843 RepID=A0A9Q0FQ47_9ROSI|nr:Gamma-glutamyltranspeptidase 3 [Turnera subulata]
MRQQHGMEASLLGSDLSFSKKKKSWSNSSRVLCFFAVSVITISTVACLILGGDLTCWILRGGNTHSGGFAVRDSGTVESDQGVVAAEDGRCSEIGASMLRQGGHAVDAAVATALSSSNSQAQAFDSRETAPLAATKDMYANNMENKYLGAISGGVPGEIAGLYEAWLRHGRLPWKTLFQPAIKLAKEGFVVSPFLAQALAKTKKIENDRGMQQVFAPNGKVLEAGDTCYNVELGRSLEAIAEQGPQAFYSGTLGEKFVKDVREAGGILTMEDLKNYKVVITDAMEANLMGYTFYGMPPPSSGTLGLSLVLNILESYGSSNAATGNLGLHRLIEAMKHMLAVRMNLGDPRFVDITKYISEMLSPSYAKQFQKLILDNTTFPPEYYMSRWSQLRDHGTSHFCIVDAERNAVSMTTTVNYGFGAGVLSPSTGILLNDEMGDFSAPTELSPDKRPPSPANFIAPNKRPLSSMTPLIITKDNQLAGVIGGDGGLFIIEGVLQVFLNHFVLGMEPLAAVQSPRVYHELIPDVVSYENLTVINGEHIEVSRETRLFLKARGHQLKSKAEGAMIQFVVQSLQSRSDMGHKDSGDYSSNQIFRGTLTAVSDPRKDGRPAAV